MAHTDVPRPGSLSSAEFGPATGLSCRECGAVYDLGPIFACAECFGPLEVTYDFGDVRRADIESGPTDIWRYRALLPVPPDVTAKPNIRPGWTRLVKADRLAAELGFRSLYVKDDSGNPTHSFKDRVVAIALEAARTFGFHTLSCSSTGNLAAPWAPPPHAPGSTRACSSPPTWRRPRSRWPRLRRPPRRHRRHLRRGQPFLL